MHGFKEILPFCVVEISCAKLPFLQELELLAVPKGEGQQTGELDLYCTCIRCCESLAKPFFLMPLRVLSLLVSIIKFSLNFFNIEI